MNPNGNATIARIRRREIDRRRKWLPLHHTEYTVAEACEELNVDARTLLKDEQATNMFCVREKKVQRSPAKMILNTLQNTWLRRPWR